MISFRTPARPWHFFPPARFAHDNVLHLLIRSKRQNRLVLIFFLHHKDMNFKISRQIQVAAHYCIHLKRKFTRFQFDLHVSAQKNKTKKHQQRWRKIKKQEGDLADLATRLPFVGEKVAKHEK